jgi:CheY-like chemotaxis protein/anti-sigma regulatory factor (Ser/Thr protein kinase)
MAAHIFKSQLAQKNINLILNLPEDDCHVLGDIARLNQVIINLLSNAIKFTHQGNITINLSLIPITDTQTELTIAVTDTGIGMTPEEVSKLFNRFSQASAGTALKYGGSGLGLYISKKIVELMGGDIKVKSEKGVGTTFSFTICCGTAPKVQPANLNQQAEVKIPEQILPIKKQFILIADDNAINRKILSNYLKQMGHTFQEADDGLEAVNKCKDCSFDIILMDIEMPIMNGLEATSQIRQYEQQSNQRPAVIIGLSGNARQQHIQTALESGMNDYITKPFHKIDIERMLRKYSVSEYQPRKTKSMPATSCTSLIVTPRAIPYPHHEENQAATVFFTQSTTESPEKNKAEGKINETFTL